MDDVLLNLPTVTTSVDDFTLAPGVVYLTGQSDEERSGLANAPNLRTEGSSIIKIVETSDFGVLVDGIRGSFTIQLRNRRSYADLLSSLEGHIVYLDITSLSHHVWAPLLRELLRKELDLHVVYVEPEDYRPNPHPLEGEIFALSERIRGLFPIPGFASLVETSFEEACFVPLLGFEGARLAYLLEKVGPLGRNIIPVVGVPGFRLEYPFHAYQGNRQALSDSKAWRAVRYAQANCPFSLYYLLEDIARVRQARLQVAPIGTKPHALGAVLFAMSHPERTELVYDHPIRKPARTIGKAKVLRYPLHSFYRQALAGESES